MISSKSDYKYVTGLDDILIDGQILPLRNDAADKTPLRGEDIAFLIEAGKDRIDFINRGSISIAPETFDKRITAGSQNSAIFWSTITARDWVKSDAVWPIKVIPEGSSLNLRVHYPENFHDIIDPDYVKSGDKLNMAPVKQAFENIIKQERLEFYSERMGELSWDRTSYIDDHDPGLPPYESYPGGNCYYHNWMVMAYGDASGSSTFRGSKTFTTENPRASSAVFGIADVSVVYEYIIWNATSPEYDEYIEWAKSFWVPIHYTKTSDGVFSANVSQIYDKAGSILGMCGVTPIDYTGGRNQGWYKFQTIRMSATPRVILEIDNRTRW